MSGLRIGLLVCISVWLGACGTVLPRALPGTANVDTLIQQQRYGRAIEILQEQEVRNPTDSNRQRLAQVREQADAYDSREARLVLDEYNRGDWAAALQRLNEALGKYPQGKELNQAHLNLRDKQGENVRQVKAHILLARAEYLIKSYDLHRALEQADPADSSLRHQNRNLEADLVNTARDLYLLGKEYLSIGDLETADMCLTMSDKLNPTGENAGALAQLNEIRRRDQQQRQAQEAVRKEQEQQRKLEAQRKALEAAHARKTQALEELIEEARLMIEQGRLEEARGNLAKIRQTEPRHPSIARLDADLQKKVSSRVDAFLARGSQYYINGKIEEARDEWLKALRIDPENQKVREHISRADRVLERLQELQSIENQNRITR